MTYFQHKKQAKKNKEQNFKTKSYTQQNALPAGQATILLRIVSYREEETLNETEMRQIMSEYGEVGKSWNNT